MASAAHVGESGGGGGSGVSSGRIRRQRCFQRTDPSETFSANGSGGSLPLLISPAPKLLLRRRRWHRRSVGQIRRRWWQRRFRWSDLVVLYPLPIHPKLLPWIGRRRRRLLPLIRRRRRRRRHPRADPAEGICLPPPTSPWLDRPMLLIVYVLFVLFFHVLMMLLL